MPILDMPLDELKQYQGRSPRPNDLDAFWDANLKEAAELDPMPVFTPYPFPSKHVDCYELRFQSTKGATIYAKYLCPKDTSRQYPAVLHFHGLGGASAPWTELLAYASEGVCIASMDVRGQGGYSQDVGGYLGMTDVVPFMRGVDGPPRDLLYRDIYLDTVILHRVIASRPEVDAERMGCMGGSQGGALALACAALVPSIKRCAPSYPYLCDFRRVWEMDLAKGAYDGLAFYFRKFDPQHKHEDELFEKLGYIDIQNLAPRIRAHVQFYTGLMDNICPPSTQFAAYNKITSEKELRIYPDYGHEELKGQAEEKFAFFMAL